MCTVSQRAHGDCGINIPARRARFALGSNCRTRSDLSLSKQSAHATFLLPLPANDSGDANHRGASLKSPLPAETASFRLPDRTVCLCLGRREYGLRDNTSHTHELTGADAPRSMGLHGPAIHADNFRPSVPQCHFAKASGCSCAWASRPWPLGM